MSRFDYTKYDETSIANQELFKTLCAGLEDIMELALVSSRPKALAMTALEECYMWIGKAIRDDQIARNNIFKEERKNGE